MADRAYMDSNGAHGRAQGDPERRSAEAAQEDSSRHISCSMTSVIVRLVRSHGGEAALAQLLQQAGSARVSSYLEDADNWVSQEEVSALLQTGVALTGDPSFATHVGEEMAVQHAGTQVATLLRSLGSVEAVLQAVAQTAGRFTTTTELEAIEVAPGRATIRAVAREGFTRNTQTCELTSGLLTGAPRLFGLPQANVEQSECQARGDAQCLYTVTWDAEQAAAAADPQQRVTALEGQLLAMSRRLHNVYGIAGDLVSTEDLDTVLRRIVERAADAVRAPSHILAVRPDPTAQLQVYRRGIGEGDAQEIARAALEGERLPGSSALVVDVNSGRRRYGKLIAHFPAKVQFFSQERELLGLYAKHAAAVLDMALALQESASRHAQVSSLLALSHALADAGSSVEVAERLAAAAPQVVDCDRMTVWLWDGLARCLRSGSSWKRTPAMVVLDREITISAADTEVLQRMLADPQPLFCDQSDADAFTAQLMDSLGMVALAIVPIVARDVFLGVLTAGVIERPERMRRDDDLLRRLTGVAALAAPALQNGQLVDQLRYKASHDSLTGLLNRVGFRQQIDRTLQRVEDGGSRVGLLFIDLNDFKQVNDVHGHDNGDELLRLAGGRLRSICRGEDDVARLGGDEFAVILADVREDEQVHAAERRVREAFSKSFQVNHIAISVGASVGGGVWPDDGYTVGDLVRRADSAMYADKARIRREHVLLAGAPADGAA